METQQLLDAARKDFPQNFIQKFVGHHVDDENGVFLLTVRWLGWSKEADFDEPIHTLVQDDPPRVEDYLHEHRDDDTCTRYLSEYFGD